MWCEKYGFLFADKSIPEAWLKEPYSPERWAALENARVKKK
jgi:hypothetical protein